METKSLSTEGNNMTFDLILYCTQTKTTDHRRILFPPLPHGSCVRHVKMQIEKECNIPSCVQSLIFDSHTLTNDMRLDVLKIRSGDTLRVNYHSDADCKEITQIINWLEMLVDALRMENPSHVCGISNSLDHILLVGIQAEFIEDLAFEFFFPWLNARKYANKLHFVENGGVDIIMELYSLVQRQAWKNSLLKLKYMEYGILRVLWNLSETFALRRIIVQHGGLEMCMKSLLHKKLDKGEKIVDRESPGVEANNQDWILVETIGGALGTLCNLSELPECHMSIASKRDILLQLTCISLTPSVRVMSPQLVATLFLCVAYTPETHRHLADSVVIERLLEACGTPRREDGDGDINTLMLHYFTQVFLSQVILVSPNCIPIEFHQQIQDFMEKFLQKAHYKDIMEGEIKLWNVWATFIPYIKLAYIPNTQQQPQVMQKLQLQSLHTIIFGLHNMLGRANHREVLVREKLLDYVICMPHYVPESLQPLARELVHMLGTCEDVQVQPPSLASLVKARLAKMHFGLEKVLKLSVSEIVTEIVTA